MKYTNLESMLLQSLIIVTLAAVFLSTSSAQTIHERASYLDKGDSLRRIHQYQQSISYYTKAMGPNDDITLQSHMGRGGSRFDLAMSAETAFEQKSFLIEALFDFTKCIESKDVVAAKTTVWNLGKRCAVIVKSCTLFRGVTYVYLEQLSNACADFTQYSTYNPVVAQEYIDKYCR